ncbi:MAG: hypothetical protein IJ318_02090 [Clostridia bacterium]|nr:hypothetical protein [Clostridia bacterium]
MKKILITAGPTNEYIDEVMKITNMSTGRLGVELTKNFLNHDCEVTLICTRSVARGGLFERYNLASAQNLKVVQIETTDDMFYALANERNTIYDLVIHASAVGDYKPEFSFKMEDLATEILNLAQKDRTYEGILAVLTNPKCKLNDNTKISSYEPNLTVKLTLTTKLISHLKEWFPNSTLVGFKLLENVSKEHLIEVAQKLCIKNNMHYIIANDLADLRKGNHVSYLVNQNGYLGHEFHSPDDIFDKTYSFIR